MSDYDSESSPSDASLTVAECNECSCRPNGLEMLELESKRDKANEELKRGLRLLTPVQLSSDGPLSAAGAKKLAKAIAHLERNLELLRALHHPNAHSIGIILLFRSSEHMWAARANLGKGYSCNHL